MKRLASALRALTLMAVLCMAVTLIERKETEVCFDNAITDRSLF